MKTKIINLQYQLLIIILLLPVVSFEQGRYYVEVKHDKFDNFSKFTLDGNSIPNSGSTVCLDAQVFVKNGHASYSLIIDYYSDDWLFIESGISLKILADSNKLELSSSGSINSREVYNGGKIRERAFYNISLEEYQKIFMANKVEFKLSGNQYYLERKLTTKNKENLKRFFEEYMSNQEIKTKPQNIKGKGLDRSTKVTITTSLLIIALLLYVML
jgi:hypothetical protein